MAQEQTAYVGDDIKVLVNVIGSTGSHVAAVINTTTTRLDGLSAAPTVTTVGTGIYQIVFSGVTPAPVEGVRYTCKVNGTIAGVAWSEYGIPVKIVADERGTDGVSGGGGLDAAGVRSALGMSSANLDTQLSDIPTVSEFNARTLAAADYFDVASDVVTTDTASRDASKADLTSLNDISASDVYTHFTSGSNEDAFKADVSAVASDVTSIKTKTDQMVFTNTNELDCNAVTGGGGDDAATIYTYFTASSRQDSFKADLTSLNDITAADVYTHFTSGSNEDAFKADVSAVASDVTSIKSKTDQMVFSNTNELDCNAVTGGGGDDAATIYTYFTASSRQDSFKADLTSLNDTTAADVFTYFTAFSREDLFKADVSSMSSAVSSIDSKVDTLDTKINTIDNVVDAVLADSSTLANIESKIDTVDTVVDSILLDTAEIATVDGKVNTIQSSVSSVPTTLQTIEGKIDTVDTVVDSILLDTAEIATVDGKVNTIQSSVSSVPTTLQTIEGKIDTVDTVVDSILVDTATIDVIHSKINTIDNVVDAVLADSSTLATIESKIDTVDTVVDSIKLDTDDLDSKINAIDNVVDAVLVDTNELQQNQSNAATASSIYTYFTDASRADAFKSDVSDLSVIRNKTDKMVFSGDNQLYVSVASGGGDTAETIYNYFTEGVREDQFKDGNAYGAGAVSHTVTITSDGTVVAGAEVWVSQDVTGVSIVAGTLHTNSAGQVTFMLDPGSYYLWANKSGVQFNSPQGFTVS